MTTESQGVAASAPLDPAPLVVASRNWTRWAGPTISVLILLAVLYQLRSLDIAELRSLLPASIGFWLAFGAYYLAGPASEWIIFRKLWGLPLRGMGALLRKLVSNEILLGYLGEVYFYAWARRNSSITAAPFGAIKDVTILSALAGNAVTLLLTLVSWPFFPVLHFHSAGRGLEWSVVFVLATSLLITFFRRRIFSLPHAELWFVTWIHFARIFATTVLSAYMWYCLLPDLDMIWLLLLSTMRLLLSRLPFLPNKDLAFAGLAAFFVGHDSMLVTAMALMASLLLATHIMVGAILGAAELVREGRSTT
jgi:hypothetical protein